MIKIDVGGKEMFIKGEGKNWEIVKKKTSTDKKTGKVTEGFFVLGYYSTLSGLIHGVLEMKLKAADVNSLLELQEALKLAKEELMGMYETTI
jgi:hypothetical protein